MGPVLSALTRQNRPAPYLSHPYESSTAVQPGSKPPSIPSPKESRNGQQNSGEPTSAGTSFSGWDRLKGGSIRPEHCPPHMREGGVSGSLRQLPAIGSSDGSPSSENHPPQKGELLQQPCSFLNSDPTLTSQDTPDKTPRPKDNDRTPPSNTHTPTPSRKASLDSSLKNNHGSALSSTPTNTVSETHSPYNTAKVPQPLGQSPKKDCCSCWGC